MISTKFINFFSVGNGDTPGGKERLLESLPDCTEFEIEGCARTGNSTTIIIPSQNLTTLVITKQTNNLTDQDQVQQMINSTIINQNQQSINSTTGVATNQNVDSATLVSDTQPRVDAGSKEELKLKVQNEVDGEAVLTDDLLQFVEAIPETSGQKFLNDMKTKCG